jgi:hypothetical protein
MTILDDRLDAQGGSMPGTARGLHHLAGWPGRDRIYDGYPDVTLEMAASRTFDGRLQLLEYVPTVLTGPPGAHLTS